MALADDSHEIVWSPRAFRSYEGILEYIESKFNEFAVRKFVRKTMNILAHVSRDPLMFRESEKGKNRHIVVITGKTTLYYRVKPRKKEVELLLFWDNRRNPKRLKY